MPAPGPSNVTAPAKGETMHPAYTTMPSPIGRLKLVASEKGLVAILWENDSPRRVRLPELIAREEHPVLMETKRQLAEYFAGERRSFTIPLDMRGTPFQRDA